MRLGITFYHFVRKLVLNIIHGKVVLNFQEGLIKNAAYNKMDTKESINLRLQSFWYEDDKNY